MYINAFGIISVGALLSAIQKEFGTLDDFIGKFNTITAAVQGLHNYLNYLHSNKKFNINYN